MPFLIQETWSWGLLLHPGLSLLLGEPLSNLDAKLREALRVELKHLQKTMGGTILFVTHDQIEALTMADRIAVLNEGQIIQQGTPTDIYDRPATTFVAQLVGTPRINLLAANRTDGMVQVKNSVLGLPAPVQALPAEVLLGIRPEDVRLEPEGQFSGQIALREPLGVETILHIRSGEQTLLSLIPGMSDLQLGAEVRFNLSPCLRDAAYAGESFHSSPQQGQAVSPMR